MDRVCVCVECALKELLVIWLVLERAMKIGRFENGTCYSNTRRERERHRNIFGIPSCWYSALAIIRIGKKSARILALFQAHAD